MRNEDEVAMAHDTLVAILLGKIPNPLEGRDINLMATAADVLCWILNHEHNDHFQKNLDFINQALKDRGYEQERIVDK